MPLLLRMIAVVLALAGPLSACTVYDPPEQPYAAQYCGYPPGQAYGGPPVVLPHPMQCFQCGTCY